MEQACQADNQAREAGQPALHKLKLLPEVTAILNRNNVQHAVLDPDTNFLQHVKFFLEPLNDGSLPAYNIQRDIFNALAKMNIEKEALLSSGIGRVVVFYTRSKKPEPSIKRIATRLLGEWSRPILKRTDDYKKRQIETRDYDYEYVLSCGLSLICADLMLDLPRWHNARRPALNSVFPSVLPSTPKMLSANVYWPHHEVTTRRVWSTCLRATLLLPRAPSWARKTPAIVPLVQVVWKLSARWLRRARSGPTKAKIHGWIFFGASWSVPYSSGALRL